jgi:hypothetical protein
VGLKDSVVTSLVACGHVDVEEEEDYCTIVGWTMFLKERRSLKRSVIDFMTRTLSSLFSAFRDAPSRYIDGNDPAHLKSRLVSTRHPNEIGFIAFQFLQHDTHFRKVVIIYRLAVNRICFLPNHVRCAMRIIVASLRT